MAEEAPEVLFIGSGDCFLFLAAATVSIAWLFPPGIWRVVGG